MPLNSERGGSVCDANATGRTGHMLSGSGGAAVCMPTLGAPGQDKRSRWRRAGGVTSGSQLVAKRSSRHTTWSELSARGAAGHAHREGA